MILGISIPCGLIGLAAIGFVVWFFFFRKKKAMETSNEISEPLADTKENEKSKEKDSVEANTL